jgi:hypothetical protein
MIPNIDQVDQDSVVARAFDRIAGAAFALGWLNSFVPTPSSISAPLFGWLLSMHALVILDTNNNFADRINTDFDALVVEPTAFNLEIGQQFRTALIETARCEWSFWLPLLLFTPDSAREQYWNSYQAHFPPARVEEQALRRLLSHLLSDPQRELLFMPDNNGRYTSQAETVIIRVGRLLKELKNTTEEELQQVFSRWYDFTRLALKHVQSGLRLSRISKPDESEYIDLLLALLAVAEWRTQPDIWRLPVFIENYQRYPEEALTAQQIALSSALFGYLEGYHRGAAGVQQLSLRRLLAGQVMALVSTYYDGEVIDDPLFYLQLNPARTEANWIITDEIKSKCIMNYHWSRENGAEPDTILAHQTSISIVISKFDIRFSYDCERTFPHLKTLTNTA